MMMGANDDDARTVNLDIDQTRVTEVSDATENVNETESELSPSSPEAMMREVANDATASIEYFHQLPRAFGQPHVEAAFQAQHTETRLTYVACLYAGVGFFFFCGLLSDIVTGAFELGPQHPRSTPLSLRIGLCAIFLLASLGLLCNRTKLREHHRAVQAISNFSFILFFTISTGLTLLMYVHNGGFVISSNAAYTSGVAYTSGLILAGGTFVMAHNDASLWTFLPNVVFAVAFCMTNADSSPIAATIASFFILGSISQQIMLQHRHAFVAQV